MKRIMAKEKGILLGIFILCMILGMQAIAEIRNRPDTLRKWIYEEIAQQCSELWSPVLSYTDSRWTRGDFAEQVRSFLWNQIPLYQYIQDMETESTCIQSEPVYDAAWVLGRISSDEIEEDLQRSVQEENEEAMLSEQSRDAEVIKDTQQQLESIVGPATDFVPAESKTVTYLPSQLSDPKFIKEQFFTEDATTQINLERLDIHKLLGYDAALKQDASMPQILIYHTHSQEGYADSVPTDASTTIMGVGEYLSALLRNEYGYQVLHHMGQYDVESRDYAYSNAAVGLEKVLTENPSIEVIIDLHRDEMREDVRLVTDIQGKETAKFMFFNGLSYTRERGEITTLPNPYIQENLAFAFQMKLAAEEYYPGLTRKSYLKGYRYNLQYRPKSLLIELGAQTNTLQEALNACHPLAHIIDMVLRGEMQE